MATHYKMIDDNGTSSIETLDAPVFTPTDHEGWFGQAFEASGLFCFILKVESEAAEFPLHAAPEAWIGYVVAGNGTLYSGDGAGDKLKEVSYNTGDFFTFEPKTQHAWKNGVGESKIFFAKVA
ncbi:MAG: cupin domain-containing protein [Verrucomicrobiota bacterium]